MESSTSFTLAPASASSSRASRSRLCRTDDPAEDHEGSRSRDGAPGAGRRQHPEEGQAAPQACQALAHDGGARGEERRPREEAEAHCRLLRRRRACHRERARRDGQLAPGHLLRCAADVPCSRRRARRSCNGRCHVHPRAWGRAARPRRLGGGARLDGAIAGRDGVVEAFDVAQELGQQEAVMGSDAPGEGFGEGRALAAQAPLGQLRGRRRPGGRRRARRRRAVARASPGRRRGRAGAERTARRRERIRGSAGSAPRPAPGTATGAGGRLSRAEARPPGARPAGRRHRLASRTAQTHL